MRGLVIRQREEARQAVRRHPPSPFGKIWKAIERDTRNYDGGAKWDGVIEKG